MVSITISSSLFMSSLPFFSLLSSTLFDLHEHQTIPWGIQLFVFLELHRLSWNSLHFPLNLRQVWAEGCTEGFHSSAFYQKTHTNTHVHSCCKASVHKQHTRTQEYVPHWHHIHTYTYVSTHVKVHIHTWMHIVDAVQLKFSVLTSADTKMHATHSKNKFRKHTHHMFNAAGRKMKAQNEVRSSAGRGQTTIYICIRWILLRDCAAIFHLALSLRLTLLTIFPDDWFLLWTVWQAVRMCCCMFMSFVV